MHLHWVWSPGPNTDFSSVQFLSHIWLSGIPWTASRQAFLSFTVSKSLLKLMSSELVMISNYLILCCPLLLLPSIFPSIRVFCLFVCLFVFYNKLTLLIRWPKYWSFSISPCSKYSGLISFRMDWFDLAILGTLKSPTPQFKSINSLVLSVYCPTHIRTWLLEKP